MANSFTGDSRWKALYAFESDPGIGVSSIGNVTLTNNGAALDSTNYKEGSSSAALVRSEIDYLAIDDENLPSGFPFKYGTSNNNLAIAFWFRPAAVNVFAGIVGKYNELAKRSWMICQNSASLLFYYGISSGNGAAYVTFYNSLVANRWYHLAGYVSKTDYQAYFRLWDGSTNAVVQDTRLALQYDIYLSEAPFAIGCYFDSSDNPLNCYGGNIDELVIGTGKLSPHECDKIRAGTFDGSIDGLAVYEVSAEVEYTLEPQVQVTQLLVEICYTPQDPNQRTYRGHVTFAINASSTHSIEWDYSGAISIGVTPHATYYYNPPGQHYVFPEGLPIEITPNSSWVRGWGTDGDLSVSIYPSAVVTRPDRVYRGAIVFAIEPHAVTHIPVSGWDALSGYGFVDISKLSEPPPFWVATSDLTITFDPTTSSYALYAEIEHEAEGGVIVGGYGDLAVRYPGIYSSAGDRGVKVGGAPIVEVIKPKILSFIPTGGVVIEGTARVKWLGITRTPPVYAVVGRKGAVVGGDPVLVITTPADKNYLHAEVATGGVKVGGPIRYPEVVVYRPLTRDTLIIVVAEGGAEVGGDACIKVLVPMTYTIDSEPAGVVVFGAGGLIVIRPLSYQEVAEGGMLVGEEPGAQDAETWVLTGVAKEPSFYTNFPFNSYAADDLRVLAAADDGIYQLGGVDDDGEQVHTGVRVTTNFGRDNRKRIRSVYCGDSGPDTEVRVESEGAVSYAPWDRDRFSVDCKVRGRELIIDVAEFDQISHFEVTPMEIAR
jgi:hypothetical protein